MNLFGLKRRTAAALGVVVGLAMTPLAAVGPASAASGDLFFSEYVEGSSNNKAIEIYNGTGATVDLAGYSVQVFSNGNSNVGTTVDLIGSVLDGDVFVLADNDAVAEILTVANQTTTKSLWNGDDAVVLTHDGAAVDVIGQIGLGDDAAEWGSGLTSTQDNTLRRKSTVS
ncbi:MAG TPA: lamin tail domain-containing protein, partial [Nocardioidaceae bacterium]|nr:lamin tail domain-containing protein [Nocardioidaceae bacterium]